MKKIFVLCASILLIGAGYLVWKYMQPEHYGKPFTDAPVIAISQLDESRIEEDIRIEGEIVRQCPASGCWFYLDAGDGKQFYVDVGKSLPVLPQKIGHRVIVEGRLLSDADEPMFVGHAVEFH